MIKYLVTLPLIAILFGCGGGSSGSSTSPIDDQLPDGLPVIPTTLSLDASYLEYAAIKYENDDWEALSLTNHEITVNSLNTKISIVTVCDSSDTSTSTYYAVNVYNLQINSSLALNYDWCIREEDRKNVTVNFIDADIEMMDYVISDAVYISSNGDVGLDNLNDARTILALGYRASDEKAFFYKKSGLILNDNDTINVDFTDSTYVAEATYGNVTTTENFEYSRSYRLNSHTRAISLEINTLAGNPVVLVPESLRTTGDKYTERWEFGQSSSFDYHSSGSDGSNPLTEIPSKPSQDDTQFSQDGTQVALKSNLKSIQEMSLNEIVLNFYKFSGSTNDEIEYTYIIDSDLDNTDEEFNIKLIDLNELPEFNLTLLSVGEEDLSDRSDYYNSSYYEDLGNSQSLILRSDL